MKKVLIISMLFFSTKAFAQNAYYDAIALSKYMVNEKLSKDSAAKVEYSKILNNYLIKPHEVFTPKTIFNDYTALGSPNFNPFIKKLFPVEGMGAASEPPIEKGGGNFFTRIGNLNVTNFADGLAKFLVQRSKEELNIAFFRRFQDFLRRYPEVRISLPATCSIVNQLAAYNYAAMLPAMRTSFHKDLYSLSANLLNLREITSFEEYNISEPITNRADVITKFLNETPNGRSISAGLITADEIIKGSNIAEIISKVANDQLTVPNDNLSNHIQLVDLISTSLRSNDEGRVWVTRKQVNELMRDSNTTRLYFGLLYASNLKSSRPLSYVVSNEHTSLQSFLNQLAEVWNTPPALRFVQYFKNVATAASEVADITKGIIEIKDETEQEELTMYADYTSSIFQFLKASLTLLSNDNRIAPDFANLNQDIQKVITVFGTIINCCYDIKSHNYGALVLHTSTLVTMIPGCESKFTYDYIKYGMFMANVIEANNSDEVKASIEAAVLPVGSSSIKRETTSNISLNAFIGPFGGIEYLPALTKNKSAFVAGITAPVGVALSWGRLGKRQSSQQKENKKIPGGKSFTIFIPLIDVGSMAAYRLGDDSSKVASEVTLSNIISPGLYLYYGLGKCPISIGIGAQAGPQLRKVTAEKINKDKNFYVRFGLNIVVDIPFFNFYTGD